MKQSKFAQFEALESRQYRSASAATFQTLASKGNVGEYTSIAINPITHQPAVAYYDVTHHDLQYLAYNGKKWIGSTIDSTGNVGMYASLQFDATGQAWVAYYDATDQSLKLANGNGSTWHTQTVDSGGSQGTYASLALTRAGLPVIAYVGDVAGGGGLKLATDTKTGWKIQAIDTTTDEPGTINSGEYCSLALDGRDRPRISYQSDGNLNYATYSGHSWTIQTVVSPAFTEAGIGTHLVLDSAGYPHISYTEPNSTGDDGGTFYAENLGSGWKIIEADSLGDLAGEGYDDASVTALVLKPDGDPIIAYPTSSYIDAPDINDLVIASGAKGKFTGKIIDASGTVGGYISMAEEPDGVIVVAYYDQQTGDLKLYTS